MKKLTLFILTVIFLAGTQAQNQIDPYKLSNKHRFIKQLKVEAEQGLYNATIQHPNSFNSKKTTSDYGNPADWNWADQFGGSGNDIGRAVESDADGNVYVVGTFSGDIAIGSSNFASKGHHDGFVAKFNNLGDLLWFSQLQASEDKKVDIYGICIDDGNIYVSGYYTGAVNFNGIVLEDLVDRNVFFAKLNVNGEVQMAKSSKLLFSSGGTGLKIDLDDENNIYVLGTDYYASIIIKYSPEGNVWWQKDFFKLDFRNMQVAETAIYYTGTVHSDAYLDQIFLDPKGYSDAFLAKSDLNGNFLWAKMGDHPDTYGSSRGISLAVDNTENIFIGGSFYRNLIIGEDTLNSTGYGYPGFLVKYDLDGNDIWVRQLDEVVNQITLDMNDSPLALVDDDVVKFNIEGTQQWTKQIDDIPECICYTSNDKLLSTGEKDELAFVCQMDQSANEEWTVDIDGDSGHGYVIGMATDKYDGVYTYAYASAEMDFFGQQIGKGTFLAKQNGDGELIWLKQFDGFYHDESDVGVEIVIDPANEYLYITGELEEPLIIPDEYTLFPGENDGLYILKYATDGTFELAIQEDSEVNDPCLAADHNGNILICSTFGETINISGYELISAGDWDVFVAKYDISGELLWAKRAGGETTEYIGIISVDAFDNVYLSGEFTSEDITVDNTSINLDEGDGNVLLAKLNSGGQVMWVKPFSGSTVQWADYYCWPTGIKTDSAGNTYLKGWHSDSCYFDDIMLRSPYSRYSFFITRIDPSGNVHWANTINRRMNRGFDYNDMDIDQLGNVYFGAQALDTLNFGNDYIYLNSGSDELFIAKYTANGILDWVKIIQSENSYYSKISNVTVYDTASLFVGGVFQETLLFDGISKNATNTHGFIALLGESILGVDEAYNRVDDRLIVYPNPSRGVFYVKFQGEQDILTDFRIFNTSGQVVFEGALNSRSENLIDLGAQPKGIYFMQVIDKNQFKTAKLVIK